MIFKCELRFVASTWPNLCLWVVIFVPGICKFKNLKNLKKNFKNVKTGFHHPCWRYRQTLFFIGPIPHLTHALVPNLKGNPFSGASNTLEVGNLKFAIFDWNHRASAVWPSTRSCTQSRGLSSLTLHISHRLPRLRGLFAKLFFFLNFWLFNSNFNLLLAFIYSSFLRAAVRALVSQLLSCSVSLISLFVIIVLLWANRPK